jgi:hypothetical protein
LIGLFSNSKNLPNVHFINGTNVVGLTKTCKVEMGYRGYCYGLFTVSTCKFEIVHDDAYARYDDRDFSQESNDILAWFFDYDPDCPPLVRQYPVKTPTILQGFSRIGPLPVVLFKTGNLIKVFSEKDGKWFEFPPELLILSKIFEVGNGFNELTKYFSHSYVRTPEDFVKELVKCGFFPIFDGTPTREQFSDFLFKSDFGCVLQKLRCEINGFLERLREECILKYQKEVEKQEVENPTSAEDLFKAHLDSIQENDFIMNFNKIFVFLLEKLRNRDDLTPEIQEIVLFLEQLVEFLTPV